MEARTRLSPIVITQLEIIAARATGNNKALLDELRIVLKGSSESSGSKVTPQKMDNVPIEKSCCRRVNRFACVSRIAEKTNRSAVRCLEKNTQALVMRVVPELRTRDRVTTTKNRALRVSLWQPYVLLSRSLESL